MSYYKEAGILPAFLFFDKHVVTFHSLLHSFFIVDHTSKIYLAQYFILRGNYIKKNKILLISIMFPPAMHYGRTTSHLFTYSLSAESQCSATFPFSMRSISNEVVV
jgi:hypothetical protein